MYVRSALHQCPHSICQRNQTADLLFNSKIMFRKVFLKFATAIAARSFTSKQGPIATEISQLLSKELNPVHLEVVDHSNGSESHFQVVVVSEKFTNLSLIKCHRLVTDLVKAKLDTGAVHALSIETVTPEKWKAQQSVKTDPNNQ